MRDLGFLLYADGYAEQIGAQPSDVRLIKKWTDPDRGQEVRVFAEMLTSEDDVEVLLDRFLRAYFPLESG